MPQKHNFSSSDFEHDGLIFVLFHALPLSFYITFVSQVLVAHACNPSYSGGRDQENINSK
jgi:hypothetical protein